ncbi:MAG: aldo/keto reductase [Polyangiales bacterium]
MSETVISPANRRAEYEPSDLFDPSADVRARAARSAPKTVEHAMHLRAVLLFDRSVAPRVAAAERLGAFSDPSIGALLRDALRDPSPLVRDAVLRAIARNGDVGAAPALATIAREDEIWFVRRTAVFAYAALAGFAAVDALLAVLDDPFWRVRHAAVLALESLGHASDEVRARVVAEEVETPAAQRAQRFLRARWQLEAPALNIARDHESFDNDPWYDDDPAVMTARVAEKTPPAERLVAMLGESHEPLRKLAIQGLARSRDRLALAGAACWLDAPRVPHAAESARKALRLASEDSLAVAIAAVGSKLPGVAAWAIPVVVDHHRTELAELILSRIDDSDARVRAAVAYAAPTMARTAREAVRALETLVRDRAEPVRTAAIAALVLIDDESSDAVLQALIPSEHSTPARVALVQAAARRDDVAAVRAALDDPHPFVRGSAVDALRSRGLLSVDERARFVADRDPWIRSAAVEAEDAPAILASERDVTVRRIAIDRVCAARRVLDESLVRSVALRAADDRDPWVRSRAARLISAHDGDEALAALLLAQSDARAMVRAAASDTLERVADVGERARSLVERGLVPARALPVALHWVARACEQPSQALIALAQRDELRAPIAMIATLLPETERVKLVEIVGEPVILEPPARERRAYEPFPTSTHRSFGRTGLRLSPVAFSGAQSPSESVFIEGRERGMNAFFWEPRYHSLTRFVRSAPKKHELHVLAGTYHADENSIVADVERTLKRLKIERLGVFLLYWARSHARLDERTFSVLERLKRDGKIAAHGFSTHLRAVGIRALDEHPWDVVMSRFNAAHTGAERALWPAVARSGAAGIAFTALCYARLLVPVRGSDTAPPSAADCYRFALSNSAVNLVLAAPSIPSDATAALEAMENPALEPDTERAIRAHGAAVYRVDSEFNALVRKGDRIVLADPREAALALMDAARAD